MSGLIFLGVLLVVSIALYLLYDAGVFKDIEVWILEQLKNIMVLSNKRFESIQEKQKAKIKNTEPLTHQTKENVEDFREKIRKRIAESHKPDQYRDGNYVKNLIQKLSTEEQRVKNLEKQNTIQRSVDGEKITDWERNYLWEGISKRKRVPCINCRKEDMYAGPEGGMSQNWRCPNCGQGINLTLLGNGKDKFWCDNIGIDKTWIRK